ncbi:MAG: hypothetical protein BMS9Abin37_0557 [Acidobacteriota bacterium]|nr:MAG: hypothetical protein BMS9Abin37_0557 [Acidobacteriota bacterium]
MPNPPPKGTTHVLPAAASQLAVMIGALVRKQLCCPLLISFFAGFNRRREHRTTSAHHPHVAFGCRQRRRRGEECRVSEESTEFPVVDLTNRVLNATVEIAKPRMLREVWQERIQVHVTKSGEIEALFILTL